MRLFWVVWVYCIVLAANAFAVEQWPGARRSDHFIVHDARQRLSSSRVIQIGTNGAVAKLDCDALMISAERIRDAFTRELGLSSLEHPSTRIHLFLKRPVDPEVQLVSAYYTDGWQYRVWIPEDVDRVDFVRGMIHVLLLEFANRTAGPKAAEIPMWLIEGLTYHLVSSVGPDLIVEPVPAGSMLRTLRNLSGADPIRETRRFLASQPMLTFNDLAQPSPTNLTREGMKVFQSFSQLFLYSLGRLPGGKAAVINMLRGLPHCWNWETAFLNAFKAHFSRLLDVEKWWSVTVIAMTGRSANFLLSDETCLQKLDEVLITPAHLNVEANALPVRTQLTLQQLITDWEFSEQRVALEHVLYRLTALRLSAPAQLGPLIDSYRLCLRQYLDRRLESIAGSTGKLPTAIPARLIVQDTIRQLDELLRQRESLRRDRLSSVQKAN